MKDIVGYEGKYAVDKKGNIYSLNFKRTGKTKKMKGCINTHGYRQVDLCLDGKAKRYSAHRLIAQAYLPDYSEDLEVDHIDRDRLNNKLENLRMATRQQNKCNNDGKGYYFHKACGKWMAYITEDGKLKYLGYFDTEEEAKAVADQAREERARRLGLI